MTVRIWLVSVGSTKQKMDSAHQAKDSPFVLNLAAYAVSFRPYSIFEYGSIR